MWGYVARRLLYNVPVFLGIVLFVMLALRAKDPVWAFLGKHGSQEKHDEYEERLGLDRPFLVQYASFLFGFGLDDESWDQPGVKVRDMLRRSILPSMSITVPALCLSTLISIVVALVSAYYRGRLPDRVLVLFAVLGMSVSFLVYIIFGQYFGAYVLNEQLGPGRELFAIEGYEGGWGNFPTQWVHYCLLPVLISVIVSMGYDTRYYRAVMVEESNRDYITTARAKGATKRKIMFVHMLKNAMIPIVTRVMITLPFLITGSILLEMYFNIPGMGRTLIKSIVSQDFPVIQTFTAILAALYIITNVLTDVLYALVDPRVRLQ